MLDSSRYPPLQSIQHASLVAGSRGPTFGTTIFRHIPNVPETRAATTFCPRFAMQIAKPYQGSSSPYLVARSSARLKLKRFSLRWPGEEFPLCEDYLATIPVPPVILVYSLLFDFCKTSSAYRTTLIASYRYSLDPRMMYRLRSSFPWIHSVATWPTLLAPSAGNARTPRYRDLTYSWSESMRPKPVSAST